MKESKVTIKMFAQTMGITSKKLLSQLNEAGVQAISEDDLISDEDKLALIAYLRFNEANKKSYTPIEMADIQQAANLGDLDNLLTQVMARQQIQALIKDDGLIEIAKTILEKSSNADPQAQLQAAAMLGRLAAVARGREQTVYALTENIFWEEPTSLETLADGDQKAYAAQVMRYVKSDWVGRYRIREALALDTADNARRELLSSELDDCGDIATWLHRFRDNVDVIQGIEKPDVRLKRVRRILSGLAEITKTWSGELGKEPGTALAECLHALLGGAIKEPEAEVLFDVLDSALGLLTRMIELRFSNALLAETYAVIERAKKIAGVGLWSKYLEASRSVDSLRVDLMEAALVLARQNRTDKGLMAVMSASFGSRSQLTSALRRHFSDARDLDPEVAEWWLNAGQETATSKVVEHKVGNTEDQQIGALLIEVESNSEAMDKVGRAVVPLLDISDPVLASTVKNAVAGYQSIAQIARRLARMRKLSKTDLKGERLDYNPLEHEMLGGHKSGVRRVKVVRDGIRKDFGGRIKTLVKPWVEPEE